VNIASPSSLTFALIVRVQRLGISWVGSARTKPDVQERHHTPDPRGCILAARRAGAAVESGEAMLRVPTGASWEFGTFTLLQEPRLLISHGTPVPLTSKAFDTLVFLVDNRDRVVTKDELLRAVWHDVIVEEGNLTQQIFLIRKALGDTAQQPRYIATVPGHGYRFTAGVKEIVTEGASHSAAASTIPTPASHPWPVRPVASVATALVILGLGGLWLLRVSRTVTAPVTSRWPCQLYGLQTIATWLPDGRARLTQRTRAMASISCTAGLSVPEPTS
jgi:DNA-binding winged helix-turn-helix (wHTH) protein